MWGGERIRQFHQDKLRGYECPAKLLGKATTAVVGLVGTIQKGEKIECIREDELHRFRWP